MISKHSVGFERVDLHLSYKIQCIMGMCQITGQQYPILRREREFEVVRSPRNY